MLPLPVDLSDAITESIERDTLDIPLLPEVAQQILALTTSDSPDLRRITELVQRDQSLAGNLLHIANSSLYAPRVPVVSLQQAVSRLGARKIRDMALIIACKTRVFEVNGFETDLRSLFERAVAAAMFAQEIARLRRARVEEAFVCGLLHDVGLPVLLQAVVDLEQETCVYGDRSSVMAFADEYHEMVGEKLAARWRLTEAAQDAIRFHHEPCRASRAPELAMMVRLADQLADVFAGTVPLEDVRAGTAVARLDVYPDDLTELASRMDRITQVVESLS